MGQHYRLSHVHDPSFHQRGEGRHCRSCGYYCWRLCGCLGCCAHCHCGASAEKADAEVPTTPEDGEGFASKLPTLLSYTSAR